ncbi:MAG: hypothetical protein ACM3NR_01420 [Methanosarcina sp.]
MKYNRRAFIRTAGLGSAAVVSGSSFLSSPKTLKAEIVNPMNRVPVSLIIDDSTCLVNMAHFGIPQFGEVFPEQYRQDWRKLPREIPDSFVREFGEWSQENGVKGKYSIVPYPACTGWVSRFIPGWTEKELKSSLSLVRELIMPNWDIHPEMVSHTRVIDIKTGKPYPYATAEYMENWEWSQKKSADELAAYQSYALNILRDAGLNCEGLTTPGGYGGKNQDNLALGTKQAVQDVFGAEISHYFRDVFTEKGTSVAPKVLYPSGLDGSNPSCVVSIYGCTEDWFGNWDGLQPGSPDLMITSDLSAGRLVDVIGSGEPAILVCHWPGIYFNGEKTGFNILKEVKKRLDQKYGSKLIWMRMNEIARYWAAKELSTISTDERKITVKAPFEAMNFTLKTSSPLKNVTLKTQGEEARPLQRMKGQESLKEGSFISDGKSGLICFSLKKGLNELNF